MQYLDAGGARDPAGESLFDLLEFGFEALVEGCDLHALAGLRSSLASSGLVRVGAKQKDSALHLVLDVPVVNLGAHVPFGVALELFVESVSSSSVRVTNRSSLQLNGLKALRAYYGDEACGATSLDGKSNVIGPTQLWENAGELQLKLIEAAVEVGLATLLNRLPAHSAVRSSRLWLKRAEFCQDLGSTDPSLETMRLTLSHMPEELAMQLDIRTLGYDIDEGTPTVRWRFSELPLYLKVYPKRADLLRLEVSCMSRRAVANLVGYDDEILDSAGAIRLLRRFSIKAVGLMTVLAKHVAQYRCAAWDAADLIHRLSPLILDRSATGPRLTQEPGRCRAFLHLLACGFFDAKGLRLGTTLRGLLEELACSGGPLVHGSRPTVYLVSA